MFRALALMVLAQAASQGGTATPVTPNTDFEDRIIDRRVYWTHVGRPGDTDLTEVGSGGGVSSGAGAGTSTSTRAFIKYTTAATTDAVASFQNYPFMRFQYRPRVVAFVRTDSSITNRRVYVNMATNNMDALSMATGPTANAQSFIEIGFDTSVDATKWRCCAGDGTNYSCADVTGATVAVSTNYRLELDYSTAGTLICKVDDFSVTKTTNLPTTTATDAAIRFMIRTLVNDTARSMELSRIVVEYN